MLVPGAVPLNAQTTALPAVADTYLTSGSPNQNHGGDTSLRVQSTGNNRVLVQFDPGAIEASVGAGRFASARLEVFIASNANNWGSEGRTVDAHRLTEGWTELGATWNCAVDSDPANASSNCGTQWAGGRFEEEPSDSVLHTNALTGWVAFDVTADVAAVLAGGSHDGWIVKKTEEGQNGRVDYAAREATGGNGPRLVLVVESAAHDEVPPHLAITSPDEPVLVNESSPTIAAEYADGGSGVNLSSLEMLLDGVERTASCTVGAAAATCAPGTLAAGAHALEVRLRDQAGNLATASSGFDLLVGPGLHTVRIPVAADTYLRQGSPNQNQGGEARLRVQQSGRNRALLRVDPSEVASLLAGATVHSARLELFVEENGSNWGATGRSVDLHRLTAAWSEHAATWNCAEDTQPSNQQADCSPQWAGGSFEPVAGGSLLVTNDLAGWVGFDVTADVSAMAGGAVHAGWLLKKTAEGQSGRVEVTSREGAAAQAPALVVVFETETEIEIDRTPPTIAIEGPADGSLVPTGFPEIAAGIQDAGAGIDVASVRFFLDEEDRTSEVEASAQGVEFHPSEALSDGLHRAAVSVWDRALNTAQLIWSFTVDTTAPEIVAITPRAGQRTNAAEIRVEGEVEDASAVASVTVNGQAASLLEGSFSSSVALVNGPNQILIVATDSAGNSAELAHSVERFSLPEVFITSPADLSTIAATAVTVEGTVSDGVESVVVNGVSAVVADSSFVASGVPLVEGGSVLTAVAADALGHAATDSVSVVRDLTPPRVVVYQPQDGSTTFEPAVAIQGLVNDLVAGSVNATEVAVTVNGQSAEVANRSFFLASLPLALGENTIEVLAVDEGGNTAGTEVRVHRAEPSGKRIVVASGNGQSAVIGSTLSEPIVVELQDAAGLPVQGRPVIFKVKGNDGSLDGGVRQRAVTTGDDGRAQATFTLGTRAGVGNQVVEVTAVAFAGQAAVLATALQGEPDLIVVDAGDQQVGVAGRELPRPFVVAVTDAGFNRLPAVPVRFQAVKGAGHFQNGLQEITVATDSDGRAIVPFTLDPEERVAGNAVEANIAGIEDGPIASFVATGWTAGPVEETSIHGVVLDNSNQPIPGVTLRIRDTELMAETDEQGTFLIAGAPAGTVYLIADGSTADRPGPWPDLEFVLTTVPGRRNDVGMPIYLVPLNQGGGLYVDETRGGTLTLPNVPGFALEVAPGSVTFPGGSRSGVVSVTAVHSDKVPMVPNFGQQPRFIVTVQPAGARFDPPARISLPNVEGLAPGSVTEFYAFDHDLGHFVSVGPATVAEDGQVIVSNPGVGVVKAGWWCGGNPGGTGTVHDCTDCEDCVNNRCRPRSDGSLCPDDGNSCTTDICRGGACTHRPVQCAECKKCDGGDCVADPAKDGTKCGAQPGMVCKAGECVCAVPTDMSEDRPVRLLDKGGLEFHYSWKSSTGRLADIALCRFGEEVTYPGGNPFVWPRPWSWLDPNPRVNAGSAAAGGATDKHESPPLAPPPYVEADVIAEQRYYFECPCHNNNERTTLLGPHLIVREIRQIGSNSFELTTSKTGASNVWSPLP